VELGFTYLGGVQAQGLQFDGEIPGDVDVEVGVEFLAFQGP